MAAIDFPASPTNGQLFSAANGVVYQYNGTLWVVANSQFINGPPSYFQVMPSTVRISAVNTMQSFMTTPTLGVAGEKWYVRLDITMYVGQAGDWVHFRAAMNNVTFGPGMSFKMDFNGGAKTTSAQAVFTLTGPSTFQGQASDDASATLDIWGDTSLYAQRVT